MSWSSRKINTLLWLGNAIALILAINMLASFYFFRLDLTEEQRYTIKEPTRQMLKSLDDRLYIEVFLAGDLNAGFKRLQRSIREILEEFRILSDNNLSYSFSDPATAMSKKAQTEFMRELVSRGIEPTNVIDSRGGNRTEKIIFPGAIISYHGIDKGVMLLKGNRAKRSDEVLNQSIEGIEFELANAIYQLVNTERKKVGLLQGHGELNGLQIASFRNALWEQYDVFSVDLAKQQAIEDYDVLIIAKPTTSFSESDKFKLDQYVMKGGKLLILIDAMNAAMDSVYNKNFYSVPYSLALDDLLFRYGLRINANLVQDRISGSIPVVTGEMGNQPKIQGMPWPLFPIVSHYADHVITKNMDVSLLRFANSIDSVKAEGIKKTPLLFSSPMAKKMSAPVRISVADLRNPTDMSQFKAGPFVLGYLLEGRFTSHYKNRILTANINAATRIEKSPPTKIIVIADGDIARSEMNRQTGNPQELGRDQMSGYTFANKDLLLNMVAYLADEDGLIRARDKEFKIRPLNKAAITSQATFWKMFNVALPLAILYIYGIVRFYVRKQKYARN